MSWLQNQQLTTVCVGFILRKRTEWSLREGERLGRVGCKQGGTPGLEVQAGEGKSRGCHEPVHGT